MSTVVESIDGAAWVVALASLPRMGPARLAALLGRWAPDEAWRQVVAGTTTSCPEVARAIAWAKAHHEGDVGEKWQRAARAFDVEGCWQRHLATGAALAWRRGSPIPAPLADDLDPPCLLFHLGDPEALVGPRVAIVGTRRCTRYGRDVAWELGLDLASAGVRVVSGLASGIDAAAHRGALAGSAPPIGVAGSPFDDPFPRSSADLWRDVPRRGWLCTEVPPGARPERWRFPARNRLIAALADVVVVVESAAKGGSLYTVDEAVRRDVPVLAVPGPVRSAASAGTNALLADGAGPCRDAGDVLAVLGLSHEASLRGAPSRPSPDAQGRLVLDALGWQPAELTSLVERTGLGLGSVSVAVDRLEAAGWISRSGGWIEQVA